MNFGPIFVYRRFTINKMQDVLGQSRNQCVHKGGSPPPSASMSTRWAKHLNRSRLNLVAEVVLLELVFEADGGATMAKWDDG
jgi:hypothetical protein